MITSVNYISTPTFFNKRSFSLLSFASLVMAAGIATAGFSLAGYLPPTYWQASILVCLVDFAIAGLLLHKKRSKYLLAVEKTERTKHRIEYKQTLLAKLSKEILLEIFNKLHINDANSTALVCKDLSQIVRQASAYKEFLQKKDWQEANPNFSNIYYLLNRVGRVSHKEIKISSHLNKHHYDSVKSIFSGNHWIKVFEKPIHDGTTDIEVWTLHSGSKDEVYTLKCKRAFDNTTISSGIGYFGSLVYLGIRGGDVLIWNTKTLSCFTWKKVHKRIVDAIFVTHERIVTKMGDEYKLWNRQDLIQIQKTSNQYEINSIIANKN